MRKLTLCAAAAVLTAVAATPAAAQSDIDWSGLYIGGTVGASWSDVSITTDATSTSPIPAPPIFLGELERVGSSDDDTGFTGSLEAGIDWQSGSWVVGIETDIGWFDTGQVRDNTFTISGTSSTATTQQKLETDWLWTLRPRLGYATGGWLFYGTAGLAMSNVKYTATYSDNRVPPGSGAGSVDDTNTGWAAGLGAAWAVSPGWSVKAEWLYADLGDVSARATTADGFVDIRSEAEVKANLIRLGIDYRF